MNPVEAGIAAACDEYRWSSDAFYRTVCGLKSAPQSFKRAPGFDGAAGSVAYRTLIQSPEASIIPVIHGAYVGKEEDLPNTNRRSRKLPRRREEEQERGRTRNGIIASAEKIARKAGRTLEEISSLSRERKLAADRRNLATALYNAGYSPTDIGRIIGRARSYVVRCARQ